MSKRLHIIYIPGFGDKYDWGRRALLHCWRILGVTTEFVPMRWNGRESYDEKLAHVNEAIDRASGQRIVLIGESAGGSVVLPIYAKRHDELYKVMTICGKNNNAASVAPKLYATHIAFQEAMRSTESVNAQLSSDLRKNFIVFYPLYDEVIPLSETIVPGGQLIRLISVGHFLTIFLALTLFSSYIVRIAKR